MAQGKQAKVLTDGQIKGALAYFTETRYPERDRVIFLLSVKAGFRAKEIAALTWGMITDAEGKLSDLIALENKASKGKSGGRTIPMNKQLGKALDALMVVAEAEGQSMAWRPVILSERGMVMSANSVAHWFQRHFRALGFEGCSSHSGRRTFITKAAKKVSMAGGSIRDVQQLAGHSSLQTTQRYVEGDSEAKRKLVNLI